MPIFAASSGIVMPGWPCTNDSASAARVPLPLRRPARRLPAFLAVVFAGAAVAVVLALRLTEPRGRPGPRRRGVAAVAVAVALAPVPPTPCSAAAAASRRVYSSTSGFSSFSRSAISWRFSSRKSVTGLHPLHWVNTHVGACRWPVYLTSSRQRGYKSGADVRRAGATHGASSALQVLEQAIARAICLTLGNTADERATRERAERSQRCVELVAIVKVRCTVLVAQDVLCSRARTRRP